MDDQREGPYTSEDDFGYEIGPDDIREYEARKKAEMNEYDDYSRRIDDYNRNDEESKEFKLLQGILNTLDGNLNSLKGKCTKKPDIAAVITIAECMQKDLDQILKMKDTHEGKMFIVDLFVSISSYDAFDVLVFLFACLCMHKGFQLSSNWWFSDLLDRRSKSSYVVVSSLQLSIITTLISGLFGFYSI